jgi:hypothetical protein
MEDADCSLGLLAHYDYVNNLDSLVIELYGRVLAIFLSKPYTIVKGLFHSSNIVNE